MELVVKLCSITFFFNRDLTVIHSFSCSSSLLTPKNIFFKGLYGQHAAKKPKITKQLLDNTFDNMVQMTGSIPSPAASQMSNMSNTNRFIKLIGGRERGRKNKSMKVFSGEVIADHVAYTLNLSLFS